MSVDANQNSCLQCAYTHIFGLFPDICRVWPKEFGQRACREFDAGIKQCCMDEFLCLPTAADIKLIVKLHKSQHNFDGMFGSLVCTHTYWRNCLDAWNGSFKGKENNLLLFWRQFVITIHIFGMHLMGIQEL